MKWQTTSNSCPVNDFIADLQYSYPRFYEFGKTNRGGIIYGRQILFTDGKVW